MYTLYIILTIATMVGVYITLINNKTNTNSIECLTIDTVCENIPEDQSTIENDDIINKIKSSIIDDILNHKVKPLYSIDDNEYRLLESFLDKGNIGFYAYGQGMNVPKYYIRKVKDNIKVIVFKNNEKIISFYKINYTDFLKSIITHIRSNSACKKHRH